MTTEIYGGGKDGYTNLGGRASGCTSAGSSSVALVILSTHSSAYTSTMSNAAKRFDVHYNQLRTLFLSFYMYIIQLMQTCTLRSLWLCKYFVEYCFHNLNESMIPE